MNPLYNVNGLVFWSEEEIKLRDMFRDYFTDRIRDFLLGENTAWRFVQVEAPLLTPRSLINTNYTNEDVWVQENGETLEELVLRPETTPGSYAYAQYLLNSHQGFKPPLVVWQAGKSFRRETEQPYKHMRLKEFYQQEFQCIYTVDTMNDYHSACLEPVRKMIAAMVHLPTRIVDSDRLPSYSQVTKDVEIDNGDKWMEVCSISRRTDFPQKARFPGKGGTIIEKDILVLEIAIGLDRIVYNWNEISKKL